MTALYATRARAIGGRSGRVATSDGLLSLHLAIPSELGGPGGATNPEQLFAAGYAACFENAVRLIADGQKLPLKEAAVTANVELHRPPAGGYTLAISLEVETEGLDQHTAEELVAQAHRVCPYSNAVRGNVDVGIIVRSS